MVLSLVLVARRSALVVVATCVMLTLSTPAAQAICAPASEAEHFARADVVFEGIAQPGNADHGTLLSPAGFEVERYLKGRGPTRVQVTTGTSDAGDGIYMNVSTGINPSAGERWRVFANGMADEILKTSTCHGSRNVDAASATDVSDLPSTASDDAELVRSEGQPRWLPALLAVLVLAAGATGFRMWRNTNAHPLDHNR